MFWKEYNKQNFLRERLFYAAGEYVNGSFKDSYKNCSALKKIILLHDIILLLYLVFIIFKSIFEDCRPLKTFILFHANFGKPNSFLEKFYKPVKPL